MTNISTAAKRAGPAGSHAGLTTPWGRLAHYVAWAGSVSALTGAAAARCTGRCRTTGRTGSGWRSTVSHLFLRLEGAELSARLVARDAGPRALLVEPAVPARFEIARSSLAPGPVGRRQVRQPFWSRCRLPQFGVQAGDSIRAWSAGRRSRRPRRRTAPAGSAGRTSGFADPALAAAAGSVDGRLSPAARSAKFHRACFRAIWLGV